MLKEREVEIKVGLFISVGVSLIMLAILLLGGADSVFTRTVRYSLHFPTVDGLFAGSKVVLGGLQVGIVKEVAFDAETKNIQVNVQIQKKFQDWIRTDTRGEIATQGVLGDKYVALTLGDQSTPPLKAGSEIETRRGKDLNAVLGQSDQLMTSLNSAVKNLDRILESFDRNNRSETLFQSLSTATKNLAEISSKLNTQVDGKDLKGSITHLNGILKKIDNGTGTLGALVNDPGLYYDARALMGGANRNRIIRNLVRRTIQEGDEAKGEESENKKK